MIFIFKFVQVICHMPYTRKIDVYSFGIVMWELCTSLLPFESMSFVQLAHAVANDVCFRPEASVEAFVLLRGHLSRLIY